MKTIEITVCPLGNTKIETKGFSGTECIDATRDLERSLGIATKDQRTAEFYSQSSAMLERSSQQADHLQ